MTATPDNLYELGQAMADKQASVRSIVQRLLDEGASELDLVRVIHRVESVSFMRARELIEDTGLVSVGQKGITLIIPEDDPWYKWPIEGSSDEEPPDG